MIRPQSKTVQSLNDTFWVSFSDLQRSNTIWFPGESLPCLQSWKRVNFKRFIAKESSSVYVWYAECHFFGNPRVLTSADRSAWNADETKMKSFKILSSSDDMTMYGDFVGLYGRWSHDDGQAIYLRMNEAMPVLYAPWNANIDQLNISQDIVVMGYDQPNYTGNCTWWASKNSTTSDKKISINITTWRMHSIQTANVSEWPGTATCVILSSIVVISKPPRNSIVENEKPTGSTTTRDALIATNVVFIILVIVEYFWRRETSKIEMTTTDVRWRDLDLYQLTFGDITLQSQIAIGGSGIVWLGTHLKRQVAIKILHSSETVRIQQIIDEIGLWTKLDSPILVALVGAVWTKSTNLMAVMEYMNIGDLRAHLSKTDPTSFAWHENLV